MERRIDPLVVLRNAKSVVLIDWPSRDVPDTLCRAGLDVVAQERPDRWIRYGADDAEVVVTPTAEPDQADLVFAYRPLDELQDIIEMGLRLGAQAVWLQSGLDAAGRRDARGTWLSDTQRDSARTAVENAGLLYTDDPYIVDAIETARF